jgi:hypothetical protein
MLNPRVAMMETAAPSRRKCVQNLKNVKVISTNGCTLHVRITLNYWVIYFEGTQFCSNNPVLSVLSSVLITLYYLCLYVLPNRHSEGLCCVAIKRQRKRMSNYRTQLCVVFKHVLHNRDLKFSGALNAYTTYVRAPSMPYVIRSWFQFL